MKIKIYQIDVDRDEDDVAFASLDETIMRQGESRINSEIYDKRLTLTCHPYEPCLYITEEDGCKTAVHNAFDPFDVLGAFSRGETISSITGREYGALDFCRMVEYAAGMSDIGINDAEVVLGSDKKRKETVKKNEEKENSKSEPFHPEATRVIYDDPAYGVINEYPDIVVEYCIVKNEHIASGRNAHWYALMWASRELFFDGGEQIWSYGCGDAEGKRITADAFFAAANEKRGSNYRGAFLYPPHGGWLKNRDFDRVNAALFPNGTEGLEVYEWTTDWSEFFDDGHEWWGALCFTVYDKTAGQARRHLGRHFVGRGAARGSAAGRQTGKQRQDDRRASA
ncbi:MAG: hypothetical protein KIG36_06380 [Eubacteriales bacterium]|nr:hypothetical protein [Eubacteriales bacterium]